MPKKVPMRSAHAGDAITCQRRGPSRPLCDISALKPEERGGTVLIRAARSVALSRNHSESVESARSARAGKTHKPQSMGAFDTVAVASEHVVAWTPAGRLLIRSGT